MTNKHLIISLLALFSATAGLFASEITVKIKKQYLNFPVSDSVEKKKMTFSSQGMEDYSFNIGLVSEKEAEYWVFCDVSTYKGKKLVINCDVPQENLALIEQSDEIRDSDTFYKEDKRPQQHFTFRRGWNNDPNGLVYYDGEYHLFAQHNPYGSDWATMHWGHAVSKDLIHWTELPVAMYPDNLGTMFSGSAVIDKDNTSGFGLPGKPAMVAFYTADQPGFERQCMAYSLDNGRSWAKYEGNPIIDTSVNERSPHTRDPRVFWYAPGGHWVLVLFDMDGNNIYTSSNLKDWTLQSHIPGFYECPDFYPLAVDGDPNNVKWVMTAASGVYLTGDFDGKKFTPDSPLRRYTSGKVYAGQTFNDFPDGRRVQIAWTTISKDPSLFRCSFSTPMEMTLKKCASDVRLFASPVTEFDSICHQVVKKTGLSAAEAEKLLNEYASQQSLRVKCSLSSDNSSSALVLKLNGQNLLHFDIGRSLINGDFYGSLIGHGDKLKITCDFIMDRGMVEMFVDGGAWSNFIWRDPVNDKGYSISRNTVVESLEIYTLDSIW